jgi:membrane protein implicated in regulation of membrane protease activity
VLLVGAILLAVFVLPEPWNYIVVIVGAVVECVEAGFFVWWTRRRRPTVGVEALVGRVAEVVEPLQPRGRVRIDGELWNARYEGGTARVGATVRVTDVDGLTLVVDGG